MHKTLLLLLFLATATSAAPPAPYHLVLEANPSAPFPFLGKFGAVTLDVFPAGVRAETFWLNGFTRNGSAAVTVENPFGRMYTDVPIGQISTTLHKLSTSGMENIAPIAAPQVIVGNVKGIPARRYRLTYGPEAWIDVWMTETIPENQQLRAVVSQFVRGISPATAPVMDSLHGTPLYVELNFRRFKKLPLLRMKSLVRSSDGADEALKVGMMYFHAPLLDSIWK